MLGCAALEGRPQVNPGSTALVANDSSLDFGTVVVGNNIELSDYIFNPTTSSVTIDKAITSGTDFQILQPELPVTLTPGQRTMFVISFTPHAAGRLSETVAISSSAQQPSITVSVTGQAIAAGVLAANPPSISFGNVSMGSNQSRPGAVTNSGDTPVTISQAAATMSDFTLTGLSLPATVLPGQSVNFNVIFTPKARGMRGANVALTASSSLLPPPGTIRRRRRRQREHAASEAVSMNIPVAGVGMQVASAGTDLGQLTATPGSLSFGTFVAGAASQSKPLALTNSGTASITITQAAATGTGYTLSGPSLPLALDAGATANFSVTFAPQSAGSGVGNVAVQSDGANPSLNVGLSATVTGPGKLTVGSSPLAFGTVLVGKTQNQSATITNSGGASLTVSQATVTGTGFSVSGMTTPMTLAPNQSANVSVSCTPQSSGSLNGNLAISSNAGNVAVALAATGIMPGALVASAPSLSFASIEVGKSESLPETVTNSGGSSITLSQAAAGAGFTISGLGLPATLAPGATASFNVVFAPQGAGSSNVNLAIVNDGPTPTFSIPLSGSGIATGSLTASSVSFGSVQVGSSSTQSASLANPGGSSVTISQATLTGTGFTMTGLSTPLTLAAGQSFTFNVSFAPQTAGAVSGGIAIVSTAPGTSPSIALSGTGAAAGQFSISPGSFAFGSVSVGQTKSLPVTISATGSSVTVTSASVSSPEFTLTGPSLPVTIAAGSSASFSLTFSPQSSGASTANVSFASSASVTPMSESVSGTGAAVIQHSVDLTWSASTSTVTGYNVYRGGTTGGPYSKVNSAMDGTLSYTDTSVQAGQTYFYTTTAVSSDGSESAHSNEVKAVIPTP